VLDIDDVAAIAMALPEVTEGLRFTYRTWSVRDKGFVWERPFSKADIKRFGKETPPDGPIIAVMVESLGEKEAILLSGAKGYFTIPHFNGYPAVLIQLEAIGKRALREAIEDAWLVKAPPKLAQEYLATKTRRRPSTGPS